MREVQDGGKPTSAKPFKGTGYAASVHEIVTNYDADTYRCVYTVKFEEAVYILHTFLKKSSTGIKTSKRDVDLIEKRRKKAE